MTIHELIDLYATSLIPTYPQVVERIRSWLSIAALTYAVEMVDTNGEDSVAVEKRTSNFEPAPSPFPCIASGQYAGRRRTDDVFGDRAPKVFFVYALLSFPQTFILNGLHPLAVDGPDLARLPDLIDSVHVGIME